MILNISVIQHCLPFSQLCGHWVYICHRINGDLQLQIDINQIEDTNDSFLELFGLHQGEDALKHVGELLTKPKVENGFNWDVYFRHILDTNKPSSTEFFHPPLNNWIHLNSFIIQRASLYLLLPLFVLKK